MCLITPFTACRHLYSFLKYSQSKPKFVARYAKFCMFLASQILRGGRGAPKKLYPCHHPYLAARHLAKVHEATQPGSKVIAANMLNFKPIFDYHLKITVRGTPVPNGKCAIKIWSFSSACKILGHTPQKNFRGQKHAKFGPISDDFEVQWRISLKLSLIHISEPTRPY